MAIWSLLPVVSKGKKPSKYEGKCATVKKVDFELINFYKSHQEEESIFCKRFSRGSTFLNFQDVLLLNIFRYPVMWHFDTVYCVKRLFFHLHRQFVRKGIKEESVYFWCDFKIEVLVIAFKQYFFSNFILFSSDMTFFTQRTIKYWFFIYINHFSKGK